MYIEIRGHRVADIGRKLASILGHGWWWLRQVFGDADYENYLRRAGADSGAPISAEEFYLLKLQRKHSKINRCC
jgi:hypothetical protein